MTSNKNETVTWRFRGFKTFADMKCTKKFPEKLDILMPKVNSSQGNNQVA